MDQFGGDDLELARSASPRHRMIDHARLKAAYEAAKADLLLERTPDGHWVGELSTSALSTATAVSALAIHRRACQSSPRGANPPALDHDSLISGGIAWLTSTKC